MPMSRFNVEQRATPSKMFSLTLPVVSALVALVLGSIPLLLIGQNPIEAYHVLIDSAFGSTRDVTDTLTEATPIMLTGLAAVVAFRLNVWNIGAEGQLQMGAVAAAGIALLLGEGASVYLAVIAMLVAGALGGSAYAGLAALPVATWKVNDVVLTLMMNFIALAFINYLVFGSHSVWRDKFSVTFPRGQLIPDVSRLPELTGRLNIGFLVALAVVVAIAWLLKYTVWGYEHSVVADSRETAAYVGINQWRMLVTTFLLSGACAGLAGAVLVGGTLGAMEPRALSGIGFTGILVAALGRMSPTGVIPAAIILSALVGAGPDLQQIGIPAPITIVLEGLILVVIAGGEFHLRYRIVRTNTAEISAGPLETAV
jgi:simple sugar transport system permease protein